MTEMNDIKTPDGYFQDLQERLQAIPAGAAAKPTLFQRVAPALAYAASLLVLVMLGNFIFRSAAAAAPEEEEDWAYVAYLAQSLDPDGLPVLTDVEY